MFRTRLISGIVLLAVAALFFVLGGAPLLTLLLILSLTGMFELYRATAVIEPVFPLMCVCSALLCIAYYAVLLLAPGWETAVMVIAVIILMSVYVFTFPRYRSDQVVMTYFGLIYVAVMLSFVYKTRMLPGGEFAVWLVLICSWGCDTFAYCFGMLFGRHRMSPRLSPKKSVEGAVGGVAGAAALGALYAFIKGLVITNEPSPIWEYALICAAGALISMIGDLAASAIKRNHDIKDYGKLIPGHGGVLDRFDSVIFTAPVIWLLASVLL